MPEDKASFPIKPAENSPAYRPALSGEVLDIPELNRLAYKEKDQLKAKLATEKPGQVEYYPNPIHVVRSGNGGLVLQTGGEILSRNGISIFSLAERPKDEFPKEADWIDFNNIDFNRLDTDPEFYPRNDLDDLNIVYSRRHIPEGLKAILTNPNIPWTNNFLSDLQETYHFRNGEIVKRMKAPPHLFDSSIGIPPITTQPVWRSQPMTPEDYQKVIKILQGFNGLIEDPKESLPDPKKPETINLHEELKSGN